MGTIPCNSRLSVSCCLSTGTTNVPDKNATKSRNHMASVRTVAYSDNNIDAAVPHVKEG